MEGEGVARRPADVATWPAVNRTLALLGNVRQIGADEYRLSRDAIASRAPVAV
jgi:hypothetical protein